MPIYSLIQQILSAYHSANYSRFWGYSIKTKKEKPNTFVPALIKTVFYGEKENKLIYKYTKTDYVSCPPIEETHPSPKA